MKHRILSKNQISKADNHIVFAQTSAKQSQKTLTQLKSQFPLARKAAQAAGWSASSNTRISFSVASPKCESGVCHIHFLPLNTKLDDYERWRSFGAQLSGIIQENKIDKISVSCEQIQSEQLAVAVVQSVRASLQADYNFTRYKSRSSKVKQKKPVVTWIVANAKLRTKINSELKKLYLENEAVSWARDLVNTPAQDLQPVDFVRETKKKLRGATGVKISVLDKSKLQKLKAGAILGVSQGSSSKPYLMTLKYKPQKKTSKRIVLVGKGVTFDSGGLSMKSPAGMIEMKCDMAGAAAVAGVFAAIAALPASKRPNVEVIGIIPLVENMVSGNSLRPGDVVRSISGKTIEVINTDAEGRLILADALEYCARFSPTAVIDLATLTGACCVALGERYAGLFCEDDKLLSKLAKASFSSGDFLWHLPFGEEEYRPQLNSSIADIKNAGSRYPGASIAALFLKEFAPQKTPWAHIDIAAPAFRSTNCLHRKKGATGFGISLVLEYLADC